MRTHVQNPQPHKRGAVRAANMQHMHAAAARARIYCRQTALGPQQMRAHAQHPQLHKRGTVQAADGQRRHAAAANEAAAAVRRHLGRSGSAIRRRIRICITRHPQAHKRGAVRAAGRQRRHTTAARAAAAVRRRSRGRSGCAHTRNIRSRTSAAQCKLLAGSAGTQLLRSSCFSQAALGPQRMRQHAPSAAAHVRRSAGCRRAVQARSCC